MQSFWREKKTICKNRLRNVNNREKNCFEAARVLAATKHLKYLVVSDLYSRRVSPLFSVPGRRQTGYEILYVYHLLAIIKKPYTRLLDFRSFFHRSCE